MEKMKETAIYLTLKISKMYFFILTGLMNTTNLKISQPRGSEERRLKITEPLSVRATNVSEPPRQQRGGNEQTAHANLFLCALHSIHPDSNY